MATDLTGAEIRPGEEGRGSAREDHVRPDVRQLWSDDLDNLIRLLEEKLGALPADANARGPFEASEHHALLMEQVLALRPKLAGEWHLEALKLESECATLQKRYEDLIRTD